MRQNHLGHFHWALQNQGRLSTREKIKIINKTLVPTTIHLLNLWLKKQTKNSTLQFANAQIPDTPIIKEALAELNGKAEIALINHSWRSYFWALAFGTMDTQDFDTEALLLAALLHDIGLTSAHLPHKGCQCFTLESALCFDKIAKKHHYPADKTQLVKDAICTHMNGFVQKDNPIESILLQKGATCDVIGEHFYRIPKPYREDVANQWKRANFNHIFQSLIKEESQNVPHSRTALLRTIGLPLLIYLNPFKE